MERDQSAPEARFHWKGLLPYEEGLALQMELTEAVRTGRPMQVIGLEHPAVITLGKRAKAQSEILIPSAIPKITVDRGGHATLHSPGQLVIYPIARVSEFGGLKAYICFLLKVTQESFSRLGIEASLIDGQPGLFTKTGKIAFLGLRIDRGVSRHGLSINITNDLKLFSLIRSCGVQQAKLDRAGKSSTEEFFKIWEACFQDMRPRMNPSCRIDAKS